MLRIIKAVLVLAVIGLIGLTAYAFVGDMRPKQSEVAKPVALDVN